jgi:hypothetical protein
MPTSVPTTPAAEDDKLEMLRINIKHWRDEKGLSYRFMPVHLWDEAIVLGRLLNVRRVACVLGLNLEELKRRMEGRQTPGGHTTVNSPPDADFAAVHRAARHRRNAAEGRRAEMTFSIFALAQLDRAPGFEPGDREFECIFARHFATGAARFPARRDDILAAGHPRVSPWRLPARAYWGAPPR